ncbi:hypothetical protein ATCVMN08101_395R [Acanthocystis turfacea Chlorella virus MN0810.1]|nr:hypothetical protein ATCVMN08101_395R [Acanthocystis turfacea Chlorella virus MN0810.1]
MFVRFFDASGAIVGITGDKTFVINSPNYTFMTLSMDFNIPTGAASYGVYLKGDDDNPSKPTNLFIGFFTYTLMTDPVSSSIPVTPVVVPPLTEGKTISYWVPVHVSKYDYTSEKVISPTDYDVDIITNNGIAVVNGVVAVPSGAVSSSVSFRVNSLYRIVGAKMFARFFDASGAVVGATVDKTVVIDSPGYTFTTLDMDFNIPKGAASYAVLLKGDDANPSKPTNLFFGFFTYTFMGTPVSSPAQPVPYAFALFKNVNHRYVAGHDDTIVPSHAESFTNGAGTSYSADGKMSLPSDASSVNIEMGEMSTSDCAFLTVTFYDTTMNPLTVIPTVTDYATANKGYVCWTTSPMSNKFVVPIPAGGSKAALFTIGAANQVGYPVNSNIIIKELKITFA